MRRWHFDRPSHDPLALSCPHRDRAPKRTHAPSRGVSRGRRHGGFRETLRKPPAMTFIGPPVHMLSPLRADFVWRAIEAPILLVRIASGGPRVTRTPGDCVSCGKNRGGGRSWLAPTHVGISSAGLGREAAPGIIGDHRDTLVPSTTHAPDPAPSLKWSGGSPRSSAVVGQKQF